VNFPARHLAVLASLLLAAARVTAEEPTPAAAPAAPPATAAKPTPPASPANPDKPAPAPPVSAVPDLPDEVVTLPAIQVTGSRVREIDVTIKRLDKLIAREQKKLRSEETDRALNSDRVTRVAALFGGKSTAQREAVAGERVRLLETERDLLGKLKLPQTRADFILLEKQIELLRTARRELDLVYR